jgi:hypothetical protein
LVQVRVTVPSEMKSTPPIEIRRRVPDWTTVARVACPVRVGVIS